MRCSEVPEKDQTLQGDEVRLRGHDQLIHSQHPLSCVAGPLSPSKIIFPIDFESWTSSDSPRFPGRAKVSHIIY